MKRTLRLVSLLAAALALAGCGFHLRKSAALPPAMGHVHLAMNSGDLERGLARALASAGVVVEDNAGPGVAELRVPVAGFDTQSLTQGGYARITEYAVHYRVEFDAVDAGGKALLPHQRIDMQREYSYDATDSAGNGAQVAQIERSLVDDMVQAIMFRLQAAGRHAAPSDGTR